MRIGYVECDQAFIELSLQYNDAIMSIIKWGYFLSMLCLIAHGVFNIVVG